MTGAWCLDAFRVTPYRIPGVVTPAFLLNQIEELNFNDERIPFQ
jgi:hypothetical protein